MFWEERPPRKREELLMNRTLENKTEGQKPVHSVYHLTKGVRNYRLETTTVKWYDPMFNLVIFCFSIVISSKHCNKIPTYLFLEVIKNGEANGRLLIVNSAVSLRGTRITQDRIAERRREQAESLCSLKEGKHEELPWPWDHLWSHLRLPLVCTHWSCVG